MIEAESSQEGNGSFVILCLGAHSDDIEIGCGGTLLQLQENSSATADFIGWCSARRESVGRKRQKLPSCLPAAARRKSFLRTFGMAFCRTTVAEVKDFFEEIKGRVNPDLIFTHWQGDAHQDHRLVSELTWNTFRNHLILEYEIPKYDGDMGRPNVFVPLERLSTSKSSIIFSKRSSPSV